MSCVLLGKSTLFPCLWWSKALTAFEFTTVLFLSICKPGVTVPVGNHFKVLRTQFSASFRWGNSPGFTNLFSRIIRLKWGGGVGGGSSFVYCFLPQVIYTISSYPVLFLPSPFQLYLITCMHFPSYPPAHYFPKTRASPSKCNKTLQKKGGIVVWTGWLQDAGLKRLHIIFNCFALHLTVSGKYGCLRNMRILWLFSKNSPIHLQTLMTWPSRCLSESI